MPAKIAVLPGDGIGPEVVGQAVRVLEACGASLAFETALIGGAAYDATGSPLPSETLSLCKSSDAVLLGAVGGPKWDRIEPITLRPEVGGLLPLRKELGLFANVRPAKTFAPLASSSPVKNASKMDLIVMRELTGGIYFGQPRERREGGMVAVDTCVYSADEVRRIAVQAFRIAEKRRKKVCSVDKANVLETSRLWRETVVEVGGQFPAVELSHMLVDNCAMQLVRDPGQFDVILTENMFGDILSDEASMITGSLGMLPSASLNESAFGLYEPIHGSAPDIAGQNKANPLATILSAAMMLRFSLNLPELADAIEKAVNRALEDGFRTADIWSEGTRLVGTAEMGDAVLERLA